MASIVEEWDTRSNMEAQGSVLRTKAEANHDITDSFGPMQQEAADFVGGMQQDPAQQAQGEDGQPQFTDGQIMSLFKSALNQGLEHQQRQMNRWERAYRAWKNEHAADSKYRAARYRGRSRLFRPKTRATTRRKQAEAAAALFSTQDAIIIGPANKGEQMQQIGADVIQELVNFRLDRSNENAGIPWFMISMGAHFAAQTTGLCCSKQYWEYKTEDYTEEVPMQMEHPVTGEMLDLGTTLQTKQRIVRDRPRVRLFPAEDVIRDPAAAWEDQSQESSYLILRYPMTVSDAKVFIESQSETSKVRFRDIKEQEILGAAGPAGQSGSQNDAAMRRARSNDGQDRLNDYAVDPAFRPVWLHECFMRIEGKDYVFWTLADKTLISDPVLTRDAYPEQGGARPVTIGVATLEPFEIDPMAPVEAWQPLQQEINDIVNLRLDTVKQTIAPLAVVRKGRGVDVKAVQNRSPDSVVYVTEKDDLTFDRPGDVSQSSYVEMEKLNADFDETAGNFSIGSVQTNRQLGETVGGMNLMSSNANAMGEFDLRVWIETWAEPVLRQIVKLEQYYEDDQVVLAIAGHKAQVFQKFTGNPDWDNLLTQQVTLTCNVGIGAADPMMTLAKFGNATQIVTGLFTGPLAAAAKAPEIVDEVFGKAGFKNASERFFEFEDKDPRIQQAMAMIEDLQGQLAEAAKAAEDKSADRASKENIAKLNAVTTLAAQEHQQQAAVDQQFNTLIGELGKAEHAHSMGMEKDQAQQQFQADQAGQDRAAQQDQQMTQIAAKQMQPPAAAQQPQQPQPQAQAPDMTPIQQQIDALARMQQQTAQMLMGMQQQIVRSFDVLAQIVAAPKTIQRDENGRPIGSVPDLSGIQR